MFEYWTKLGMPSDKIVVGVSTDAYSRLLADSDIEKVPEPDVGVPVDESSSPTVLPLHQVRALLADGGTTQLHSQVWLRDYGVPGLIKTDGKDKFYFVSYEDRWSAIMKTRWTSVNEAAGLALLSLENDMSDSIETDEPGYETLLAVITDSQVCRNCTATGEGRNAKDEKCDPRIDPQVRTFCYLNLLPKRKEELLQPKDIPWDACPYLVLYGPKFNFAVPDLGYITRIQTRVTTVLTAKRLQAPRSKTRVMLSAKLEINAAQSDAQVSQDVLQQIGDGVARLIKTWGLAGIEVDWDGVYGGRVQASLAHTLSSAMHTLKSIDLCDMLFGFSRTHTHTEARRLPLGRVEALGQLDTEVDGLLNRIDYLALSPHYVQVNEDYETTEQDATEDDENEQKPLITHITPFTMDQIEASLSTVVNKLNMAAENVVILYPSGVASYALGSIERDDRHKFQSRAGLITDLTRDEVLCGNLSADALLRRRFSYEDMLVYVAGDSEFQYDNTRSLLYKSVRLNCRTLYINTQTDALANLHVGGVGTFALNHDARKPNLCKKKGESDAFPMAESLTDRCDD